MLFLAGLFGGRPVVSLAMLFIMNLFTGAMMPLVQSWFNEQLESVNRATLLSFRTTFETMGGSIGLLFAGRIADTAGIPFEWQIAGADLDVRGAGVLGDAPARGRRGRAGKPGEVIEGRGEMEETG